MLYFVTKEFTGGLLAGITAVEETTVPFPIGFRCDRPAGGSPYIVRNCEPARPGHLAWYTCFAKLNAKDSETVRSVRRAASIILTARGAEEVGSSDINHTIFGIFRRCEGDLALTIETIIGEALNCV